MKIYINTLPFLENIETLKLLKEKWSGGLEITTEGPQWKEHPLSWLEEIDCYKSEKRDIAIHAPIWELNLASSRYRTIAEYSFEVYKTSVKWAALIGAKHVVIHPNLYSTPIYDLKKSQLISKRYLRELGDLGEKLNVDILIENIGWDNSVLFNQDEFLELFNEIPTVSALLDTGHAHINNWDIPTVIKRLGKKLKAMHLHDNNGILDEHLPIGDGTINWSEIWEELQQLNHDYVFILEYDVGTSVDTLLNDVNLVEKKMGKK